MNRSWIISLLAAQALLATSICEAQPQAGTDVCEQCTFIRYGQANDKKSYAGQKHDGTLLEQVSGTCSDNRMVFKTNADIRNLESLLNKDRARPTTGDYFPTRVDVIKKRQPGAQVVWNRTDDNPCHCEVSNVTAVELAGSFATDAFTMPKLGPQSKKPNACRAD